MRRTGAAFLVAGLAWMAISGCDDGTSPGSDLIGEYTAVEVDGGSLPTRWRPAVDLTGALLTIGDAPTRQFAIAYLLAVHDTTPPPPPDTTTPPDTTGSPPDTSAASPAEARLARALRGAGAPAAPADRITTDTCFVHGSWKMEGGSFVVLDSTIAVAGSMCGPEIALSEASGAIAADVDATEEEGGPYHALRFEPRRVAQLAASPDSLLFGALQQTRTFHVLLTDQAGVAYDARTELGLALQGAPIVALVQSGAPDSLSLMSIGTGRAQLILFGGARADTIGITVIQ